MICRKKSGYPYGVEYPDFSLSNSAKCDSENQYNKTDWDIEVFTDRNKILGEFLFPAFIDLFFYITFLTYPEKHDSGKACTQWADVNRKDVHPCGDDALDQ